MRDEKLTLNDFAIAALRESAKWCMFLSVVGFIFIGLMIIGGGLAMVAFSSVPDNPYGGGMGMNPFYAIKAYLGIIYIVMALIYFFPVYYLYNYAKYIKQGLESGNSDVLANGLVNLKSHHKYLGIFTIIMISLYVLAIVAGFIFAASMASGRM